MRITLWYLHENDHSLPSGTEVKNTWTYASTPPCVFMGTVLNYLCTRTTLSLPTVTLI
jgi:hypothetical protein